MQQSGIVVSKEGDFCTVEVMRTSACVGCSKQEGCISCKKKITSRAYNPEGNADIGDVVTLESRSSQILFFAVIVFVLPIVLALVTFFVVEKIASSSGVGLIAGACIFILSYVTIYLTLEKKPDVAKSVVIVEVRKK